MLPLDLLNELITLLDDASTYQTFALASLITSQLCRKDEENAKTRFTMPQKNRTDKWYSLPNGTQHGPEWVSTRYNYAVYLNGKHEGPCWEWYVPGGSRYHFCHWHNGILHGKWEWWEIDGQLRGTLYYVDGRSFTSTRAS